MSNQSGFLSRRSFIASAAMGAGALASITSENNRLLAGEPPKVTSSRATSGDLRYEPNWAEKLTLTVGPKSGDLTGNSDKAIQAAVDYVARLGGGTVKLLPGEFAMRNSVQMQSGVRLVGSGAETILKKNAAVSSPLNVDSDWYDQEVTLKDASGFQVGDGICLQTKNPHNGSQTVLIRTIVAKSGNRIKLNKALRKNYWLPGNPEVTSLFALLNYDHVENIEVTDLTLDGNKANNPNLNGNYAGGVFAQDCRNLTFNNVESRNYNGDGFSWQICHDVRLENCWSHDNAGLGLHPGSGSQRPIIRNNKLERNNIGIFFCWGVKFGLAEDNFIDGNRQTGVSIGHRDTDNLVQNNKISNSGIAGILFRPERGKSYAGHRNTILQNELVNNGSSTGLGIDIQGGTEQITIKQNQLSDTRAMQERIGIRLGAETSKIVLESNQLKGFTQDVQQLS